MECTADLRRGHPTTGKAGRDNAQAYAGSIRRDCCLAPGGDMSQPIRGRDSETSGNDDGKGNARCMKRKFSSRNLRPASMTCLGCLRPFHEKGKARTRSSYATHPITPGCQHANMSTCQNTEHIHESAGHAAGNGSVAPPAFRNITGRPAMPLLRLRPIFIRVAQGTIPRADHRMGNPMGGNIMG